LAEANHPSYFYEKKKKIMKRFIPIFILIIVALVIYFSGIYQWLTFEHLKAKHVVLKNFVASHFVLMVFSFLGVYILTTALSIPGALLLSLLGGYLFAQPLSTILVVIGATCGATLIFLAARTAIGDLLKKKAGPFLQKMEKGFKENAASYLLFLRLVPVFPFWLVNLAPAFFQIKLRTFIWTTVVGILPGSFVFTQAGRGLGAIFETQKEFSIGTVLNLQVKIALIALGIFALIPILIKKIMKKKSN